MARGLLGRRYPHAEILAAVQRVNEGLLDVDLSQCSLFSVGRRSSIEHHEAVMSTHMTRRDLAKVAAAAPLISSSTTIGAAQSVQTSDMRATAPITRQFPTDFY